MTNRYRTAGINIHNSKRGALKMFDLVADDFVLNESSKLQPLLRHHEETYITNLQDPGPDQERKSLWANTIVTREQFPSVGEVCLHAADRATPYKIAPDRTIVVNIIDHPIGRVARVVIHSHVVGEQYDNPNHERTRESAEYARVLKNVIRLLKTRADHIVVSGDVNLRPGWVTIGWESVYEVLVDAGLEIRNVTPIDILAWDRLLLLEHLQILEKERFHTDHNGFRAVFREVER